MTIENCIEFSGNLNDEIVINEILPVLKKSSGEKSWRVRFSVAETLPALVERL